MQASDRQTKSWSATQVYTMAVICLILGIAFGYLLRAPGTATASAPPAVTPRPAPSKAPEMPSAADMKRMADKQVAPLLEELQKNPKDPELLGKIGEGYLAAQQYQSAQPYLDRSVALKATPDNLNELSYVYYALGDVDKAIDALNRALKLDPKNAKVLYNLGMFEWHGKSDPKAAIAAWQRFIKADPNNPKRAQVEKMISQAQQHLNIPPGTKTAKPAS